MKLTCKNEYAGSSKLFVWILRYITSLIQLHLDIMSTKNTVLMHWNLFYVTDGVSPR